MSIDARCEPRRTAACGFTMIESLAVVMIIGLLIALLLPSVQSAREAARRQSCANNLAQIGFATEAYHQMYRVLPAGTISSVLPVEHYPNGYHHSWLVRILPMLGQRPLAEQVDWTHSCYDPANWPVATEWLGVLECPSDYITGSHPVAISNYAGVFDGRLEPLSDTSRGLLIANRFLARDEVADGFSYTLLAGEKTLRLNTATDYGWMSGTRSTLRTTGYAPRQPPEREDSQATGSAQSAYGAALATVERPYGKYLGDADFAALPERASGEEEAFAETPGGTAYAGDGWDDLQDDSARLREFPAPPPPGERTQPGGFDSRHDSGLNMLWADGRVGFVTDDVDRRTFAQMGMRDDGMPLRPLQ